MFDHDAFGQSGGAGGVDDIGQVVGSEADGGGIGVGCGLVQPGWSRGIQIEHRQGVIKSAKQLGQVALGEQGYRLGSPPA